MKPLFRIFLFVLISPFIASCSAGHGNDKIFSDTNTIKELASEREKELLWTRELESVRLVLDTKKNAAVQDNIILEPVVMLGAQNSSGVIYPVLDGFGSLDTSSVSKDLKASLDKACTAISKWKISELNVESKNAYTAVLFKYDIENEWKSNFKAAFPAVAEGSVLFSSWLYGNPFAEDESIQIPVRFFSKYGTVDVLIFFAASSYHINEIQIQKWERKQ